MKILTKQCQYCKQVFEKSYAEGLPAWGRRVFCSRSCHYSSKRVEIVCATCRKTFVAKKVHASLLKTCSRKCMSEHRRRQALDRQANDPSFAPPVAGTPKAKKIARALKTAYREGRMDHMQENWREGSKRWTGKGNPRFKDGNGNGYKTVKVDGKWIPEHRAIMEKKMGRKLKDGEVVHHINGIKTDNRRDNLIVMTISDHVSHHRNDHK